MANAAMADTARTPRWPVPAYRKRRPFDAAPETSRIHWGPNDCPRAVAPARRGGVEPEDEPLPYRDSVGTVVKLTFSLDPQTVELLTDAAQHLAKPKSEIVRDAIRASCARFGRLSKEERRRLLATFDELVPKIPKRPQEEVDRELREIREARRAGGRKPPSNDSAGNRILD